jgi:hypothetical protein
MPRGGGLAWWVSLLLAALAARLAPAKALPADWAARIKAHQMLYTEDERTVAGLYEPVMANGYLSFPIGGDSMYLGGVFNNKTSTPSHRARIPSTHSITISGIEGPYQAQGSALDLARSSFFRRGRVSQGGSFVDFEQCWYAHRSLRSVLVMELRVKHTGGGAVELLLSNFGGGPSVDINFTDLSAAYPHLTVSDAAADGPLSDPLRSIG